MSSSLRNEEVRGRNRKQEEMTATEDLFGKGTLCIREGGRMAEIETTCCKGYYRDEGD